MYSAQLPWQRRTPKVFRAKKTKPLLYELLNESLRGNLIKLGLVLTVVVWFCLLRWQAL
ncbi:MAG: hypothetical protein AAFP20_13570 [Cyanobacteria bacterium J06614_10]